jgi:hypothetical protein
MKNIEICFKYLNSKLVEIIVNKKKKNYNPQDSRNVGIRKIALSSLASSLLALMVATLLLAPSLSFLFCSPK